MAARNPGDQKHASRPPGFHAPINFFLAVFFRDIHDGLSERETTPSQAYELSGPSGRRTSLVSVA